MSIQSLQELSFEAVRDMRLAEEKELIAAAALSAVYGLNQGDLFEGVDPPWPMYP